MEIAVTARLTKIAVIALIARIWTVMATVTVILIVVEVNFLTGTATATHAIAILPTASVETMADTTEAISHSATDGGTHMALLAIQFIARGDTLVGVIVPTIGGAEARPGA